MTEGRHIFQLERVCHQSQGHHYKWESSQSLKKGVQEY